MFGWLFRGLFVVAGSITGWFVLREDLHFAIFQAVIALILFIFIMTMVAFWPTIRAWFWRK